jgi:CubicO group peptidase (beta-lactamase class C family)
MSLPTVFDYQADADFPAATPQRRARFASTRVVDLLHHAAGWRTDRGAGNYGYHNAFFTHGRQALPLVPGDFRRFVRGSQLDFVSSEPGALGEPGEIFRYNNAHFIAASEAVSWRLSNGRYDEYSARMEDWWHTAIGQDAAIPIPNSQPLSTENGEAPLRGKPGYARSTIVSEEVLPPGLVHGWVPHAYGGGADLKVLASGFYSMSAAAMARILQGMHPNVDPAANLLTWEQVLSLRDAVQLQKLNAEGQYEARVEGLSVGVESLDFAGVTMFKFAHSGAFPGGPGAVAIHLAREDDGAITSISWCGASTVDGGVSVVGLQPELETLQALGYLDDERDLFPELLEI